MARLSGRSRHILLLLDLSRLHGGPFGRVQVRRRRGRGAVPRRQAVRRAAVRAPRRVLGAAAGRTGGETGSGGAVRLVDRLT